MKGWQIFLHSVRLVFRNLDQAFRVSIVLYLVQAVNQIALFLNPPQLITNDVGAQMPAMTPGSGLQALVMGIVALLASLWIAVAWHRFVLKEEYPAGWLPRWHGSCMVGYLGRSILLGFAVGLGVTIAAIPAVAVLSVEPAAWGVVYMAMIWVAAFIFFRLAVMLPASALGESLPLSEAWRATSGESGTFTVLAALVVGASIIVMLPSLIHNNSGSLIDLVYGIVVNWFMTIIGISVLTTLYGHFIQKRPID
ncbi:hypothetical protein [Puniceibacterium sp. IMCC21224]|uniref:hypothetical protein n=1 Tax=Puniceibacterium sp. IMCC21224 TaxID=1618204 RepID=UPI00064D8958|nr:hypothetical protein [Puniceibacterium sp. IMCC21224]KMK65427.1 hypothetical protein IMCC21224_11258 [Puniceibacterium sp. IMCC21224]